MPPNQSRNFDPSDSLHEFGNLKKMFFDNHDENNCGDIKVCSLKAIGCIKPQSLKSKLKIVESFKVVGFINIIFTANIVLIFLFSRNQNRVQIEDFLYLNSGPCAQSYDLLCL